MEVLNKYEEVLKEMLSEIDRKTALLERKRILVLTKLKDVKKSFEKEQKRGSEMFLKLSGQPITRKKNVFKKKDSGVSVAAAVAASEAIAVSTVPDQVKEEQTEKKKNPWFF